MANKQNSWLQQPTNLYNFIDRKSDVLLVTVGDSWTWGADLPENTRCDCVFGNLISKKSNYDWLNLAIPAQGNFWIADMVEELAALIPEIDYKKIYVVCVFTSVGRWFNTYLDITLNYIEWFKNNINHEDDFDKLLLMLNQTCVSRIVTALSQFSHVKLKIGTNFVDDLGFEILNDSQFLKNPWYTIMGLTDTEKVYACGYYDRLPTAIEFIDSKYHSEFKKWFIKIDQKSEHRLSLLKSSDKFINCHPQNLGHAAWANYVLSQL